MNSNKNSGVDTKEEIFLMLTTPSCSLDDGRIFKKIQVCVCVLHCLYYICLYIKLYHYVFS